MKKILVSSFLCYLIICSTACFISCNVINENSLQDSNSTQSDITTNSSSNSNNYFSDSENKTDSNTSKNEYEIQFYSLIPEEISPINVFEGDLLKKPKDPKEPIGYHFDGWYQDSIKYDFSTPIRSNIKLTAKYSLNKNYSVFDMCDHNDCTLLLSAKDIFDSIDNYTPYLYFNLNILDDFTEQNGLYLQVVGRHNYLSYKGLNIFSLSDGWQNDIENIPDDFFCIYDEENNLINDYIYTNTIDLFSTKREMLQKNKTYTVRINLDGRFYKGTEYEKDIDFLSKNFQEVYLGSIGGLRAFISNIKIGTKIEISQFELSKTATQLNIGESMQLIAYTLPSDPVIEWRSSNNNVASIDEKGNILAKNKGTTTIMVTTKSGKSKTCSLNVIEQDIINLIVAQDGSGDFKTLNSAFDSIEKGKKVHITLKEGVYDEVVNVNAKFQEVIITGTNKEKCIIYNGTGVYKNSPMLISGNFTLENLSFKVTLEKRGSWTPTYDVNDVLNTFPGYALHIDWDSFNPNQYAYGLIKNCYLYSEAFPAVGMGVNKNQTVEFENCVMERNIVDKVFYNLPFKNAWKGAFICHAANDSSSNVAINQLLILSNNKIHTNFGAAAIIRGDTGTQTEFTFKAVGNTFLSDDLNNDEIVEYWKEKSHLDPSSCNNNVDLFNYTSTTQTKLYIKKRKE